MGKLIETIKKECKETDPTLDWFNVYYTSYAHPEMREEEILDNARKIIKEYGKVHIRKGRKDSL